MKANGWLHAEQVCAGLEEAVQTMKLNEVAEVIVQPQYGFGSEEHAEPEATIPANSTLFYTVELVELTKVPSCICYSICTAQEVSGLAVIVHVERLLLLHILCYWVAVPKIVCSTERLCFHFLDVDCLCLGGFLMS